MPLKTNVGVSRKIADNNYGSRGASVNLEVELDSGLTQEPQRFQDRIRQVFRLAQQAVDEELARYQPGDGTASHAMNSAMTSQAAQPSQNGGNANGTGTSFINRRNNTMNMHCRGMSKSRIESARAHMQTVKKNTLTATQQIVQHLPADTRQGFADGRQAGHDLVRDLPYLAGAAAGLGFGVSKAVVGTVAASARLLFGLGVRAVRTFGIGSRSVDETAGQIETA